jgi:hypothetical protein
VKHLIISMILVLSFGISASFAVQNARISNRTLHQAASAGDLASVKLLIENGADVNETVGGFTPLHKAAERGRKDVVELLIQKGADVNAKGNGDLTPLHLATSWRNPDVAELLIAKGADVNAKDLDGRTPLSWAQLRRNNQIVELLKKHGATETAPTGPNQRNVLVRSQRRGTDRNEQQTPDPVIDLNSISSLDPLKDPNAVKARLKMFQSLESDLRTAENSSSAEIENWNTGLEGCTPEIVKAVYEQVGAEYDFVRKMAVQENAAKTTAAIDGVLLSRQERFDKIVEKMQEEAERRELLESRRGSRSSRRSTQSRTDTIDRTGTMARNSTRNGSYGRGRYTDTNTRTNGRRRSREEVTNKTSRPKVNLKVPFADPNKVRASIKTYEGLEKELMDIERLGIREMRGWTSKQAETSPVLANATYQQVVDELTFIRKISIAENAAKTTVAIDGLMVTRQERLDGFSKGMLEEKRRLRREERTERTERTDRTQRSTDRRTTRTRTIR